MSSGVNGPHSASNTLLDRTWFWGVGVWTGWFTSCFCWTFDWRQNKVHVSPLLTVENRLASTRQCRPVSVDPSESQRCIQDVQGAVRIRATSLMASCCGPFTIKDKKLHIKFNKLLVLFYFIGWNFYLTDKMCLRFNDVNIWYDRSGHQSPDLSALF